MTKIIDWLKCFASSDCPEQDEVIKEYLKDKKDWSIRKIAKDLDLDMNRVWQLLARGKRAYYSEIEWIKRKTIDERKK
jgi:DNA-directed RNA polymerase specialized sigma24 family protein